MQQRLAPACAGVTDNQHAISGFVIPAKVGMKFGK
jgi:hypothetical protein